MEGLLGELRASGLQLLEGDYVALMQGFASTGRTRLILDSLLPEAMETVYTWSAAALEGVRDTFARL